MNNKILLLAITLLFFITIVIHVILSMKNITKEKESFSQNPSMANKFLTVDMNGNTSLYTTNKDSIIVTDSNGAIKNLPLPKGLIMIWYNNKTTNPTKEDLAPGWSLCDGGTYNGFTTPDLRGRFILGAGNGSNLTSRTVGNIGGEENHTLSKEEMPSHNHNIKARWSINGAGGDVFFKDSGWSTQTITNVSNLVDNAGGNQPHNNMPPFYVLCYICYTGDGL